MYVSSLYIQFKSDSKNLLMSKLNAHLSFYCVEEVLACVFPKNTVLSCTVVGEQVHAAQGADTGVPYLLHLTPPSIKHPPPNKCIPNSKVNENKRRPLILKCQPPISVSPSARSTEINTAL